MNPVVSITIYTIIIKFKWELVMAQCALLKSIIIKSACCVESKFCIISCIVIINWFHKSNRCKIRDAMAIDSMIIQIAKHTHTGYVLYSADYVNLDKYIYIYRVTEKKLPIVGPFILCNTVKEQRYLTMLREEIWPVISTLENIEDLIFMPDGTPPHLAIVVYEWLNAHFPGRWMGRDITPCYFSLWKNLKGEYVKLCLSPHKSFL